MIKRITLLIFLINFNVCASPVQEDLVNIYCFHSTTVQELDDYINYVEQKYSPNPVRIVTHYVKEDHSLPINKIFVVENAEIRQTNPQ